MNFHLMILIHSILAEDGEEKEAKKEEILTKIKDMFQLGEEETEEAPEEGEEPAEEPAAEEEPEA